VRGTMIMNLYTKIAMNVPICALDLCLLSIHHNAVFIACTKASWHMGCDSVEQNE